MKTPALVFAVSALAALNVWQLSRTGRITAAAEPRERHETQIASVAGWGELERVELGTLGARLASAGLPPHLRRAFIAAQMEEQFRVREETIRGPRPKLKFWHTAAPLAPDIRAALLTLRREKSRLYDQLLGPDAEDLAEVSSPFPPEKRSALRRLLNDYAEALKDFRSMGGNRDVLLPVERAQRVAFEAEQRRELAELLTPAELAEYEFRSSELAVRARESFFAMAPTEKEFRAIVAAQRAVVEQARSTDRPVVNWVDLVNRGDLRADVDRAVRAAVGEERYADYRRAKDYEFQVLARVALRGGGSFEGATQVWQLRGEAALASGTIADDRTLSGEQKAEAFQALSASIRQRAASFIGEEAANAYLAMPFATWFNRIERGWAVTIHEQGMEARPITPAAKAGFENRVPPR